MQKPTEAEALAARLLKEAYTLADDYRAKGHVPLAFAIEHDADQEFDAWCLRHQNQTLQEELAAVY